MGSLFNVFAVLAIIIIPVSVIMDFQHSWRKQRTKEIGVRKVLGASVSYMVVMLSSKFTQLILVAVVIAVPVCMVGYKQLAAKFCVQSGDELDDISWSIACGTCNRLDHGEL
jgi:putative ABC transport system permease protein